MPGETKHRDPIVNAILESLPVAVLALDRERHIRAANAAARAHGEDTTRGIGDLAGCINAANHPQGCGHSAACKQCVVFRSASTVLGGGTVHQEEARVMSGSGTVERVFIISASPFVVPAGVESEIRALVVLQDVTALHRLRGMIPICAHCKSIRRDDEAWDRVEKYIEEHAHVLFTHSICPDCIDKHYPASAAGV
jgi:PAS domain-containing protein